LNHGGTFIFDCFVPNLKLLAEGLDRVKEFDGDYEMGNNLTRFVSMKADPVNQISHITFELVWDEKDKRRTNSWEMDLRLFFRFELEHLIRQSQFELVDIKGDFTGTSLTSTSKEFIITCRKT
jgi:hypothetical protein